MQDYQFIKMKDFSNHQIDQIRNLEQLCKTFDRSSLRVGIECLKEIDGDEAYLCNNDDNQLIGFLSWHTSDGIEANINGMVHPDFRRQGIFHGLLKRAASDIQTYGIQTCCFRIPSDSEQGSDCIRHLGASLTLSQFSMLLNQLQTTGSSSHPDLVLRVGDDQDFEFMVTCFSQTFGNSESWSGNYLIRTQGPERVTYVALDGMTKVGMIRVNYVSAETAFIHDFCVLPSCQGRGYGREILSGTVRFILDQKCSQVRLGVVTQNRRALNLYQSIGFEVSAEFNYYNMPLHTFLRE
ncbi:GNAT family N-acetyltransferase [Paenibacillus glycanilyticus]|uniref:GNAT family N-acetyltransferase n=1 Tax=Paenibacillus glycanilyticus TaxID=126569 RepID=UPI00203FFAB4|nr:GNAT family N-acetyltransferase [Paenibacillus glycanilyticus]MCM3629730.1 GNAT family N-acetyltransferase [Paenibacillus glycanilyticus]